MFQVNKQNVNYLKLDFDICFKYTSRMYHYYGQKYKYCLMFMSMLGTLLLFQPRVLRARSGYPSTYRVRRCMSHHHTPLVRLILHASNRHLHNWNRVGAKKVSVRNIAPRAFRRRRVVRYWHYWRPLGCWAIELGKPPQGCDINRRVLVPEYIP